MVRTYEPPPRTTSRSRGSYRQPPLTLEEHQYLRRNPGHHSGGQFWDSLSRIHLTRRALKALDRRTRTPPTHIPPTLHDHSQSSVTRKLYVEIQRLACRGGPDLADLRGFTRMWSYTQPRRSPRLNTSGQSPTAYQMPPSTQKETPTSKMTPYSANFRQRMQDQKMMSNDEPQNWAEINARLAEPRPSISSLQTSDSMYCTFRGACDRAVNEATLRETARPLITGTSQTYYGAADVLFNNLAPVDATLSMVKPDWYDGAYLGTIPQQVRRDIGQVIIPSTRLDLPAAPNFFSEWKGEAGRKDVLLNQLYHDSAIGARAMHALQNYGAAQPQYDGNAYSLSTSFHQDGTLKVFSTHIEAPETADGQPTYHTAEVNAYAMTGNPRNFREGVTAYRNARDYAAEMRDSFIAQVQGVVDRN